MWIAQESLPWLSRKWKIIIFSWLFHLLNNPCNCGSRIQQLYSYPFKLIDWQLIHHMRAAQFIFSSTVWTSFFQRKRAEHGFLFIKYFFSGLATNKYLTKILFLFLCSWVKLSTSILKFLLSKKKNRCASAFVEKHT